MCSSDGSQHRCEWINQNVLVCRGSFSICLSKLTGSASVSLTLSCRHVLDCFLCICASSNANGNTKRIQAEHVFISECINETSQQKWHGVIQTMWQKSRDLISQFRFAVRERWQGGKWWIDNQFICSLWKYVGLCTQSYTEALYSSHLWWPTETVLLRKS